MATIDGIKMSFDFSSNGFQTYLNLFAPYSILFTAAFITITAHLAIERLGFMNEANINSFMVSNRVQWVQVVREFSSEIKTFDPYMCKKLLKQLMPIHDYLFDKGYKISTLNESKEFFNKFFASQVQTFEENNIKYRNIACYQDDMQSYTWGNFSYIISIMIDLNHCYTDFTNDLQKLYQEKVLEFSKTSIDAIKYEGASIVYYINRKQGKDIKEM